MCMLVTRMSPAKKDEPIEMPLGMWTREDPKEPRGKKIPSVSGTLGNNRPTWAKYAPTCPRGRYSQPWWSSRQLGARHSASCGQSAERPSANDQGLAVAADVPPTTYNFPFLKPHFTGLIISGFSELKWLCKVPL